MAKLYKHKIKYEDSFVRAATDMLNCAIVERNQFGNSETIFAFTPNKLALMFQLEIMYQYDAAQNGMLPIVSAQLTTTDRKNIQISPKVARLLIKMCYKREILQH